METQAPTLADLSGEVARLRKMEPHPADVIRRILGDVLRNKLLCVRLDNGTCWVGHNMGIKNEYRKFCLRRPHERTILSEVHDSYGRHIWKAYGWDYEISYFDLESIEVFEGETVYVVMPVELPQWPCSGKSDFTSAKEAEAFIAAMDEPAAFEVKEVSLEACQ